ncbi:MAG: hypothetical protein M5U34_18090 [Chloroflexi bacterium]|nr:hypothetical protein [Chloroflexota bacterium]
MNEQDATTQPDPPNTNDVHNGNSVKRLQQILVITFSVLGVSLVFLALAAEYLGLDITPGFGAVQMLQFLLGVSCLTLAGFCIYIRCGSRRPPIFAGGHWHSPGRDRFGVYVRRRFCRFDRHWHPCKSFICPAVFWPIAGSWFIFGSYFDYHGDAAVSLQPAHQRGTFFDGVFGERHGV